MSTQNLPPPIPEIHGDIDIILDVYTHISLRPNTAGLAPMNLEYGNTDRLADLGATALNLSVTNYLYELRPLLSAQQMRDRMDQINSDTNIGMWLRLYKLKEKLRVEPSEAHVLDNPVEMKKYFDTFIGAVFFRNGLYAVQNWISALIEWSSANVTTNGINHVTDDIDDF